MFIFSYISLWVFFVLISRVFVHFLMQEAALEEMKKELQAKPTEKLVDDLRKKVKILQVVSCTILVIHTRVHVDNICCTVYLFYFNIFLGYK